MSASLALTLTTAGVAVAPGCMALSPQLPPTDFKRLERVRDRSERERAYAENAIYKHREPQGKRYTKGTSQASEKRSWQSLDVILKSDASSAAALPKRQMRLSRVFTALTIVAAIVTVAGAAASAREGLDLGELNGTGGLLLGGGLATVGFGITAGVFYGKTRKGYEKAVDVYNDALGVRLGIIRPDGEYVPPRGTLVDDEGYVVLDGAEEAAQRGPKKEKKAPAKVEGPAPAPEAQPEAAPEDAAAQEPGDDAATPEAPDAAQPDATVPAEPGADPGKEAAKAPGTQAGLSVHPRAKI